VGLWGAGLWWPREGPLVSLPREGQWPFERKPAEGRGSSVCRRKGALGSIESKMGLRGDLVFCFKWRGAADLWFASPREEGWPAALSLCGVLSGLLSQSQRSGGLCVGFRG